MILGDSVVKSLNEYGLSKKQNIKVQSFSGYTTEDMLDIVKYHIVRYVRYHLRGVDLTQ